MSSEQFHGVKQEFSNHEGLAKVTLLLGKKPNNEKNIKKISL